MSATPGLRACCGIVGDRSSLRFRVVFVVWCASRIAADVPVLFLLLLLLPIRLHVQVTLSGFVSVFFEKVLKSRIVNLSVWDRNFQVRLHTLHDTTPHRSGLVWVGFLVGFLVGLGWVGLGPQLPVEITVQPVNPSPP